MSKITKEQIERCTRAEKKAKAILKKGDEVRCNEFLGIRRTFIFEMWDGGWMVSENGISDYRPVDIDLINKTTFTF